MNPQLLTSEQRAEAERIYQILRERTDADLRHLAELLAGKQDNQLLGATEFEVRDRVHRIGAQAIETALQERKKRGTRGPAAVARTAKKRPNSRGGKRRPG